MSVHLPRNPHLLMNYWLSLARLKLPRKRFRLLFSYFQREPTYSLALASLSAYAKSLFPDVDVSLVSVLQNDDVTGIRAACGDAQARSHRGLSHASDLVAHASLFGGSKESAAGDTRHRRRISGNFQSSGDHRPSRRRLHLRGRWRNTSGTIDSTFERWREPGGHSRVVGKARQWRDRQELPSLTPN